MLGDGILLRFFSHLGARYQAKLETSTSETVEVRTWRCKSAIGIGVNGEGLRLGRSRGRPQGQSGTRNGVKEWKDAVGEGNGWKYGCQRVKCKKRIFYWFGVGPSQLLEGVLLSPRLKLLCKKHQVSVWKCPGSRVNVNPIFSALFPKKNPQICINPNQIAIIW